jgi:ribonuclease BN (tRNA processing enzyme)
MGQRFPARVSGMRLTVLGGCGAWPAAGDACSGFLVEHDGYRLVLDIGYATLPRLLSLLTAEEVDAVLVSHGHPDHCADLNPLLRARALGPRPEPPLPVYALPGALGPVLALDRPGLLDHAYQLNEFAAGSTLHIGPFQVDTRLLPHSVPNAGVRLTAGGRSVAYTGDSGPSPDVVALARDADLLIGEATFVDSVPASAQRFLTSAAQAAAQATEARVGRLMLTHLQPGTDHGLARDAAGNQYAGPIDVATGALVVDLS